MVPTLPSIIYYIWDTVQKNVREGGREEGGREGGGREGGRREGGREEGGRMKRGGLRPGQSNQIANGPH